MSMKLLLFSLLFCLGLSSYGQTKDTTSVPKPKFDVSQYKYYRPGIYLDKAGRLGTGKYVVALSGSLLAFLVSANPDSKNAPTVILVASSITFMVMDIAAFNNIKKAGLATEERRTNLTLGVAPTGMKLCYNF